jgi:hypothetical protein
MDETRSERWVAAAGFGMLAAAGAAVAFERGGGISANAPVDEVVDLFAHNRAALQTQSLLFVISAWLLATTIVMVSRIGQRPVIGAETAQPLTQGVPRA